MSFYKIHFTAFTLKWRYLIYLDGRHRNIHFWPPFPTYQVLFEETLQILSRCLPTTYIVHFTDDNDGRTSITSGQLIYPYKLTYNVKLENTKKNLIFSVFWLTFAKQKYCIMNPLPLLPWRKSSPKLRDCQMFFVIKVLGHSNISVH